MSHISPIFIAVYVLCLTCILNSFEISQIEYKFLLEGKLNRDLILDKHEDLHFLICSQKCWRNSECSGIALGALKENNKIDNKRSCYLLKNAYESEQYSTLDDCDDEEVEIYKLLRPVTTTSTPTEESVTTTELTTTATEEPVKTTELTTTPTEELTTTVETTTSTYHDKTKTEDGPVCDGEKVIVKCSGHPERNVIVALEASSGDFLGRNATVTTDCTEPFKGQDILSSETIWKSLFSRNGCEENEVFAGMEFCIVNKWKFEYELLRCKKILDGFLLKVDENQQPVSNKDDPSKIRCPQGTFIVNLRCSFPDLTLHAKCGTLERKMNPLF